MSTYRITVIAFTCGNCVAAKTQAVEVYRLFTVHYVGIVFRDAQLLGAGRSAPPPVESRRW